MWMINAPDLQRRTPDPQGVPLEKTALQGINRTPDTRAMESKELLSHIWLFANPMDKSMEFFSPEY